jgi:hypothetical protein
MMTSVRVRRIVAGFAVGAMAWAVAFGSTAGATAVGADEYVQTVCDAIAPFPLLTEQLSARFQDAAAAYSAQPSQVTATALREALVATLDQSAGALDQITDSSRTAGTPDVKRGAKFATAVTKQLGALADALHGLATQAGAIDVGSSTQFATEFKRISSRLQAMNKRLSKRAKHDPAFENGAAPLRPLVVFMTTDAETCPT